MFMWPRLWLLALTAFGTCGVMLGGGSPPINTFAAMSFIVTMFVWLYDNRFYFNDVQRERDRKASLVEPPPRTTTPTIEETSMAKAQLRVAWNIIKKAEHTKNITQALYDLEGAGKALQQVRKNDPAAAIEIVLDEKKELVGTFTHDAMAALLLEIESDLCSDCSDTLGNQAVQEAGIVSKRDGKQTIKNMYHYSDRAKSAIEKALKYKPDHVPYLLKLAGMSKEKERREIVAKILKMEPYNAEALEMANRFT